jgi:hypothetical protein
MTVRRIDDMDKLLEELDALEHKRQNAWRPLSDANEAGPNPEQRLRGLEMVRGPASRRRLVPR